jgi:hypothetical protein
MHWANFRPWLLLAAAFEGEVEPPAPGLDVPPHAATVSPAPARQSRIT